MHRALTLHGLETNTLRKAVGVPGTHTSNKGTRFGSLRATFNQTKFAQNSKFATCGTISPLQCSERRLYSDSALSSHDSAR